MPASIENGEPGAARPGQQCSRFTLKNLKDDTYCTRRPVIDSFASADRYDSRLLAAFFEHPAGCSFFLLTYRLSKFADHVMIDIRRLW